MIYKRCDSCKPQIICNPKHVKSTSKERTNTENSYSKSPNLDTRGFQWGGNLKVTSNWSCQMLWSKTHNNTQWVHDLVLPRWRHPSLPEDGSPCSWENDPPGYLWKAAQPDGPKLTGGGGEEEEEEVAEAAGRQPWRRSRRRERKARKKN